MYIIIIETSTKIKDGNQTKFIRTSIKKWCWRTWSSHLSN